MKKFITVGVIILAVACIAAYIYKTYNEEQEQKNPHFYCGNGRIEATEIYISTRIAGRIDKIFVKEGQMVKAGDVLVQMCTDTYEAQLAKSKATVEVRKSEYEVALAKVRQTESTLEGARKQLERDRNLNQTQVVSEKDRENSETKFKTAQADVAAAQAGVKQALAAIKTAEAEVRVQQVDLDNCKMVAPRDGRVQYLISQEGEVLSVGGRVLNLVDLSDVYMTFFLPEYISGRTPVGAEVHIVLDAAPDEPIPAKVTYVSSVAQFTPKTVETQEERQKMMFRIKAHIDSDLLKEYVEYVKTGLPGVAWVQLDNDASWDEIDAKVAK